MRSRSTQISRSFTPRTTRGEGWLHDLTGPACPPTSAAHRIPTPPALAAPTPVRTNTSMHGSAEGQSGLKGTYSARKRFPNTRYAVSVASRPSVMLCSGPNIKRMACSQASRCPQCRVSRRGASGQAGTSSFSTCFRHTTVTLGAPTVRSRRRRLKRAHALASRDFRTLNILYFIVTFIFQQSTEALTMS